jgi:hypothetical protein
MMAKPGDADRPGSRARACCLSPEKPRATNPAPSVSASNTGSIGVCRFASPFFDSVPISAAAENWPFRQPVHPVVLDDVQHVEVAANGMGELPEARSTGNRHHLKCRCNSVGD